MKSRRITVTIEMDSDMSQKQIKNYLTTMIEQSEWVNTVKQIQFNTIKKGKK